MTQTIITAFANQKGGVGKTTSAVNVAASVASLGYSVLLADADPQGNTTSGVGVSKKSIKRSIYDVLIGNCAAEEAVIETKFKNLSLIPSSISLAGAEFELITSEARENAMKKAMDELRGKYDFIFIDCPPSLGMLTVNSLTAADGVIIPMQCEYFALEGLAQLMMTIKKVKQMYNPRLSITGILITMHDGRLNLSAQVLDELKRYYADKLFMTAISRNVKVTEAASFGAPVLYHDKYSKGALAYMDVAKEFVKRVL